MTDSDREPPDSLARRFEESRARLKAVARRMLGSDVEAEDAVQETWLRLSRSNAEEIGNLGGWLTTVTTRICLDTLRARATRPETPLDAVEALEGSEGSDAESDFLLADSMGPALMIVLDHLPPAERVAFVLHDLFAVPFEEVATILERTPEAARQLASRARRRIQNRPEIDSASNENPQRARAQRQSVVDAFLAASRAGDFEGLLRVLSPDAILRVDALAVETAAARRRAGAPAPEFAPEIHGARAVAQTFKGQATGALRALIDGHPGAVWAPAGKVVSAFVFRVEDELVTGIDLVMEPARLAQLHVELLTD